MSEPRLIQGIRATFDGLTRGEIVLGRISEDVEYRNAPDAIETGTRHGPQEFEAAVRRIIGEIDYSKIEIQRWAVRDSNEAVTEVLMEGTGRASGAPVAQTFGAHFVYDDGRLTEFGWFRSWDEAAARAGVESPAWQESE